ncbi:MAG TPA: PHB depolymerase family esterase, partial [Polyangiaceae bacterium]
MTLLRRLEPLAWLWLTAIGCNPTNLDAISRAPAEVGGGSSTGGASSIGGTSSAGDSSNAGGTLACPSSHLPAGDTTETLQVGTTTRSYVLHVPSTYDGNKPVPLIVDFHALQGSGARQRSTSPYPAQTDPEGVVMAFPSGLSGPSGAAWNFGPCCVAKVDDVAFVRAMVARIQSAACIDAKRVYAVGISIGGGMAHYLGCRAADVFAAV